MKKSELCLGWYKRLSRESSFESEFRPKRRRWAYYLWYVSGPGIPPTLDLEEGEALYDKRNKIVRQLPFWQQYGVVSQHFSPKKLWSTFVDYCGLNLFDEMKIL